MPAIRTTTVPDELLDLVTTDALGHVSSIGLDGSICSHIVWIDWDGEHLLISSPVGSVKGRNWRANPQAGITVVDRTKPFRYIQAAGRVTEIRPDEGLAVIDRLSRRYRGEDYPIRTGTREVFVITLDRVRASLG
jgi:PPOX class probable F420-dependent enzyme